jgi:alpha-glucosidase
MRDWRVVGTLYEDAGDGFGYKKGEYLQTKFSAIQKGDNITLTLNSIEGKLKTKVRQIQLILISDTNTKTSKWIKSSERQTLNVKL